MSRTLVLFVVYNKIFLKKICHSVINFSKVLYIKRIYYVDRSFCLKKSVSICQSG